LGFWQKFYLKPAKDIPSAESVSGEGSAVRVQSTRRELVEQRFSRKVARVDVVV
jgi:hypothetical protein